MINKIRCCSADKCTLWDGRRALHHADVLRSLFHIFQALSLDSVSCLPQDACCRQQVRFQLNGDEELQI